MITVRWKLSENQQKFCNHNFNYQVVHGFFQSERLEYELFSVFLETQNDGYKKLAKNILEFHKKEKLSFHFERISNANFELLFVNFDNKQCSSSLQLFLEVYRFKIKALQRAV